MNDYDDKLKAAVDELNNLPTTEAVIEHLKASGVKAKRSSREWSVNGGYQADDMSSMTCTLSVYLTHKIGLNPDLTRVRVAGAAYVVNTKDFDLLSGGFALKSHVEHVEKLFDSGHLPELEASPEGEPDASLRPRVR